MSLGTVPIFWMPRKTASSKAGLPLGVVTLDPVILPSLDVCTRTTTVG